MRLLITGGAGFVGSSLAIWFRKHRKCEVICLDNLKRRGSELTLPRLKQHGISFIHGDVRNREDTMALPSADLMFECSAEPSVLAGYGGSSPAYLIDTNLTGAINCFEWARCHKAGVIFISTSRVYPFDRLKEATFSAAATRLELNGSSWPGISDEGVSEEFTLAGIRSLYGATKLSAELMLAEYGAAYDIPFVINRCGVLAGPWQFGKTDQGVFTHWLLSHHLGRPLSYIGYGGDGKQVRDLLHVEDLAELLAKQIEQSGLNGKTWNVGGGRTVSLSLQETTALCREITGREVPITSVLEERPADIPWYVTDARKVRAAFGWEPQRNPRRLLQETYAWIKENEQQLIEAL